MCLPRLVRLSSHFWVKQPTQEGRLKNDDETPEALEMGQNNGIKAHQGKLKDSPQRAPATTIPPTTQQTKTTVEKASPAPVAGLPILNPTQTDKQDR